MSNRCVLGCPHLGDPLHSFPNPKKFPEKFKAWVSAVTGEPAAISQYDVYKTKRLCDKHFAYKDRNRKRRLNASAVPSLHLDGISADSIEFEQVTVEKTRIRAMPVGISSESGASKEIQPAGVETMPEAPVDNSTKLGFTSEEINALVRTPDPLTQQFVFHHTTYRIKDPRKSIPFYTGILGMTLLHQIHFSQMKASLFILGYEKPSEVPTDNEDQFKWAMTRKGTLELLYAWGTENDYSHYHTGNTEPKGFSHIGILVPDIDTVCDRIEKQGVKFLKKPSEGRVKGPAFIEDPDGYRIEIYHNSPPEKS